MNVMTKEQFKARWESNDNGGGITFEDIAECYIKWGLGASPRAMPMIKVRHAVLRAANTVDAEDYAPPNEAAERELAAIRKGEE